MEREVVIVGVARTPFGRFLGSLKDISVIDLGVKAMQGALARAGLSAEYVEEVYWGNCLSAEAETPSVLGRQTALKAGIPPRVMSVTVDTACCSAMLAVRLGYQAISCGMAEVVVAGGAESMSRIPYLIPPNIRWGTRIGHLTIQDFNYGLEYKDYNPVSVDAAEVALEYGVTRAEQDLWALRSQQCYAAAKKEGKFRDEIIPIELNSGVGHKVLAEDEQPRPDTTLEKLAKLPTVYNSLTITPGNAPGLNDGAAALVLMSREKAKALGIQSLGTIIQARGCSTEPRNIATIPGIVIGELLDRSGLSVEDIDLIEINEAFAAMPLVTSIVLSKADSAGAEQLRKKINVNGGAVAMGHPIGASGARIIMTLLLELSRRGGGHGIASICGGLAQGEAILIQV